MTTTMHKALAVALSHCPEITTTTLDEFLGVLLERDPDDLAQLPGTPGTVLAAQFTCYAKSSVTLSETLRRQTEHSARLADVIWRVPQPKESLVRNRHPATEEEEHCDPDPLPDPKQPAACAAGAA